MTRANLHKSFDSSAHNSSIVTNKTKAAQVISLDKRLGLH